MVGIVLGVSMAPTNVRLVLVEGEGADGVTVDQDNFDLAEDTSPCAAPDQVLSAILGTREGALEGGYQLASTGVTWTDHVEAAALRDLLIAHKIEHVMLVSAFMAAAALAQAIGDATNYAHTALLFVEPYTATMAVVNTADGSIADVRRRRLADNEDQAVAELVELVSGAESLDASPDGVVVIGSGVDIPLIKPALEAATTLRLSIPDEPETALARGAALASAHAPLFSSSTAALAYAQDPGTGEVDPLAFGGQLLVNVKPGKDNVAYSAVADEDADARTVVVADPGAAQRRPLVLLGSAAALVATTAVVALEIALAISIRPTVALRPSPNENIISPTRPAIAAPPHISVPAPRLPLQTPVAAPHPLSAAVPAAPPVHVPVPVVAPPVVPLPRVPIVRPPLRGPGFAIGRGGPFGVGHGPAPFGRGPLGGGHGAFGGRGPFGGHRAFGGGRGPFGGGLFGGRGPFGGGLFGGGRGPFGGGLFGGHGFGGFGGGHGFGGFGGGHGFGGFGGFGRR